MITKFGAVAVVAATLAAFGTPAIADASASHWKHKTFDLDNPNSVKDFAQVNGKWEIRGGEYGIALRNKQIAATIYKKRKFATISVEARLTASPSNGWGGILVKASVDKSHRRVSGYLFVYENDGDANLLSAYRLSNVDLETGKGDVKTLCARPVKARPSKPHTLTVEAHGKRFDAAIDGDVACSFGDGTFPNGRFGLATLGRKGEVFAVDELEVWVDE